MPVGSTTRNLLITVSAAVAVVILGLKFIVPVFANLFAGVGIEIPPLFFRYFGDHAIRAFFVTAIVCAFGSLILFVCLIQRIRKTLRSAALPPDAAAR